MSRSIRFMGALAALLGLLIGVPWLLVRLAGWPLPTKTPDWSNAATMMQQGNIEGTTVIKVLACVVWVAWIVIAWAVVWEAIVNVPRMLKGRRHEPTPLAPAAVSKGVGWLFTVLLATTAVSQPAQAAPSLGSLAGLGPDDLAHIELSIDASGITTERSDTSLSSFGTDHNEFDLAEVWVADDSDSLWSIAQQSGVSVDEILVANAALSPTSMIKVGTRIRLPEGVAIPDEHRADGEVAAAAGDPATSEASPTVRSYVVRDNDGMWNVADALLGDGSRHVEMAELAIGQEVAPGVIFTADTFTIHSGWVFSAETAVSTTAPDTADTYSVVKDDSLSSIAEETLGDQDRWVDLWDLNGGRTMNDGRVFDDPDLIHPGWELELTARTVDEIAEPSADEVAEPSADDIVDPPVDDMAKPRVDDMVELPVDGVAEPPVEDIVEVRPQVGLPPPVAPYGGPVEAAGIPSASGTGPAFDKEALEDEISDVDWQRSVWARIAAGSLLLAGLAVMVRRLRLRRLARLESSHRLVQPPSVASGTELAVTRSPAPMNELSTLRGLLQSLTPYASEQADPPPVRAVQIGSEHVEVLFTSPAPMPPKGWSTIDGGQSWTHRLDDESVSSRQLLTPALVTIGIRSDEGGDEVLLDLETAASVAIAGDHDAAMGLARSMALELATYPLGVPMDLCLIGLHVDGTETCDRVWLDTTLQRAVRVTLQRLDSMGSQGSTSMVAARAELDEDDGAHDPTVFIVNVDSVSAGDRALLDELIDICQPSTGTAVVLVGDHLNANEQIRIDADSSIVWSDVSLLAPNVTLQAAAEAAVMLDHAANAESETMEPRELMVTLLDTTNPDDGDAAHLVAGTETVDTHVDDVPEYEYTPPTHDVLLQVMGSVAAHGVDLTFDETELLGLITCLRGHSDVHIDLICEAIAPDRVRKTVENRVSKLRGRLGVGSDGVDILPAADKTGRGLNAIYSISNLVLTDVDLLEHRLHTAHTLSSTDAMQVLRDGLDLMNGPLFRARKGFDGWPHSEGVVVALTSVITNYACRLIELAMEVDDIALVVRTTAVAGSVLDNPVAEFPFRQVEEEYAEACGDEQLAASVGTARQRLVAYLQDDDSLATP